MENFEHVKQQLVAAGFDLRDGLAVDGRIHRVYTERRDEKRGWYVLREYQRPNGQRLVTGSYGIWQGNDNNKYKIELGEDFKLDAAELAALKKQQAADRKKADAKRAARAHRAAVRARDVWETLNEAPPDEYATAYLDGKKVDGHGVRYSDTGALVVPIRGVKDTRIQGLQLILPKGHARLRKPNAAAKQYWPAGLAVSGNCHLIGPPLQPGGLCLIAEGYATAATLYEATGLSVAVAFAANNLKPVAVALARQYRGIRLLVCADDDYLQRCKACGEKTDIGAEVCAHCGEPHQASNPGITAASLAALEVSGAWIAPTFPASREGRKLTDFNDLALFRGCGPHTVGEQIRDKLAALEWEPTAVGGDGAAGGEGGKPGGDMVSSLTAEQAVRRYRGTYGMGGDVLFDEEERRLVHKKDVINLLPRSGWDDMRTHRNWRVVREQEIGFDPTESDPQIKCNLYGGWPTVPAAGDCSALLGLLEYMCSAEPNAREVYEYLLNWLAYPIQNRGAKLPTAPVIHGGQGTGKSRFFEAYGSIYGDYYTVVGQDSLEDRFNSDWASKKLFILADEVLARADMYHTKNRLKGFITGRKIRVNPKNLAAHVETNHMNVVFLSNEHQPLVLEHDDRRHVVIWVPPSLGKDYFLKVDSEIENGGVAALHDFMLNRDLSGFNPWQQPPMTRAKMELIERSASSEERFAAEWFGLELETADGDPVPLCPVLGSTLYAFYERWCRWRGEFRPRPMNHFIGYLNKLDGWTAGKSEGTFASLAEGAPRKTRKMVVPSEEAMARALKLAAPGSVQATMARRPGETKAHWLTRGYYAAEKAIGVSNSAGFA